MELAQLIDPFLDHVGSIIDDEVERRLAPARAALGLAIPSPASTDSHAGATQRKPSDVRFSREKKIAIGKEAKQLGNFEEVGRRYDVDGSAVRRWAHGKGLGARGGRPVGSKNKPAAKPPQKRRQFTREYKVQVAAEAKAQGVAQIVKREKLAETALRKWMRGEGLGPVGGEAAS